MSFLMRSWYFFVEGRKKNIVWKIVGPKSANVVCSVYVVHIVHWSLTIDLLVLPCVVDVNALPFQISQIREYILQDIT